MSLESHSNLSAKIATAVLFSGVASFTCAATNVDLGQFTPDPRIIGYSVYVTNSAIIPGDDKSGLATGGLFGSGGTITFGDQDHLRAPYITAVGNVSIGGNVGPIPTLNIGENLTVAGSADHFDSTIQVLGAFTAGGTDIGVRGDAYVQGAFSLTGNQDTVYKRLQLGGGFTGSGSLRFATGSSVLAKVAGPLAGLPTSATYGTTFPASLPYGTPLSMPTSGLPGYDTTAILGYQRPPALVNINITTNKTTGDTDTIGYKSGSGGSSRQQDKIWHCSIDAPSMGLPASACHGDTLQAGYYGYLNITGQGRVVLVGEGFFSFDSIKIASASAIMAAQPTGGRTILQSNGTINGVTSGGNQFIGPVQARNADSLQQFAGGTMMVISSYGNITMGSDQRIWATLSAPHGTLAFNSQVLLFGQAFGKNLTGVNQLDFGKGDFIPFRGLIPPILGLTNFSVQERADTSCHDSANGMPTGKLCRDTILNLTLPNTTAYPVIFQWTVVEKVPRSAIGDTDFKVDSGWDTIPPTSLTAKIRVRIFDDSIYEGPESLWVVLKNATAAGFPNASGVLDTSIKTYTVVGTIVDNDVAPRIRIQRVSARDSFPEGNSGTSLEAFDVTLLDPTTGNPLPYRRAPQMPIFFRWGTSDGTATVANNDYAAVSGKWDTVPANSVSKRIYVQVVGDTVYEPDEWFLVHLDSLVHTTTTGNILSDTGWIANDDVPTIAISGDTVQEPSTGFVDAVFPVHLQGPSKVATSFVWRTVAGTATSGLDYLAVDSTVLTLPAGTTDTILRVRVLADSISGEGTEAFKVVLSNLNGLTFGIGDATGTILDATTSLHLSLDSVGRVKEADTTVHFHLALNWYPADTVRVVFRTISLGAHSGEQYRDTSGLLLFYPGKRVDSIPVRLFADTVWEPDLSFELHLDTVSSRIPLTTDSIGIATITDDGSVPTVQYVSADTSVTESLAGTVPVRLRLSRPAGVPISVAIPVLPATTATAGTHYSLVQLGGGDVLTFPARTTAGSFGVAVVSNKVDEPDRKVVLGISPTSPLGKGKDSVWTLTIVDDDHIPVVEITTPPNGLHTNTPTQSVCWKVDGVVRPCIDTTFPPGPSTVTRCYTDQFGNTGCDTHTVWVDTTPPAVQVFKITGPNTHDPKVDTTWWGKRARTRFGVDTVWYWVRDSIENLDKSWHVKVDTHYVVTNLKGDGVYPVPVSSCDSVGNCGYDTGWIDLKQSIPGVGIQTPPEGGVVQVGAVAVNWVVTDNGRTLTFDDTKDIVKPGVDTVQRCYTDDVGNTGCDVHHVLADPIKVKSAYYLDTNGDGRIDAMVVNLASPWTLLALPTFDAPLDTAKRTRQKPDSASPFYKGDSTRLLVHIKPSFAYGITGFPVQIGTIHETWSSDLGPATYSDTFPIADSVAPVILQSTIDRVENYTDPDTLRFTPSEPIEVAGKAWLEVGTCRNDSAICPDSLLVWHLVPADSVHLQSNGSWWILVQPGKAGSVKPGYKLRFLSGVADSLGNRVDSTKSNWTSVVSGDPRPPLLEVTEPGKIPYIGATERDRQGAGGILLQATSGDTTNMQWWEPGRGYLTSSDAAVRSVCQDDGKYCNGPSIYVNYPVKMIIYVYDHEGVFVISKTVEISQADLDGLKGDKIDRLKISIQWNHRTDKGKVVATGVYHWRVMSYVKLPGRSVPVICNQLFNLGVKVQGVGGMI